MSEAMENKGEEINPIESRCPYPARICQATEFELDQLKSSLQAKDLVIDSWIADRDRWIERFKRLQAELEAAKKEVILLNGSLNETLKEFCPIRQENERYKSALKEELMQDHELLWKFKSLKEQNERLSKGLNEIIKHQEFVGGSASKYSTVIKIAKEALSERQEERSDSLKPEGEVK